MSGGWCWFCDQDHFGKVGDCRSLVIQCKFSLLSVCLYQQKYFHFSSCYVVVVVVVAAIVVIY